MRAASSIGRALPSAMMKSFVSSRTPGIDQPLIRSIWTVTVAGDGVAGVRTYTSREGLEVGDPYYGGPDGFEVVYRQLTEALERWLA